MSKFFDGFGSSWSGKELKRRHELFKKKPHQRLSVDLYLILYEIARLYL